MCSTSDAETVPSRSAVMIADEADPEDEEETLDDEDEEGPEMEGTSSDDEDDPPPMAPDPADMPAPGGFAWDALGRPEMDADAKELLREEVNEEKDDEEDMFKGAGAIEKFVILFVGSWAPCPVLPSIEIGGPDGSDAEDPRPNPPNPPLTAVVDEEREEDDEEDANETEEDDDDASREESETDLSCDGECCCVVGDGRLPVLSARSESARHAMNVTSRVVDSEEVARESWFGCGIPRNLQLAFDNA
jgi:hypothetical protein